MLVCVSSDTPPSMTNTESKQICSRPPHWLFVLPWDLRHIGGVNEVVRNLASEFHRIQPRSSTVVNTEYGADRPIYQIGEDPYEIIRYTLRAPFASKRPVRQMMAFLYHLPRTLYHLRSLLNKREIDAVNVHYPSLSSLVLLIACRLFRPRRSLILSFHGADMHHFRDSLSRISRLAWRILLNGADHLVFCSHALLRDMTETYPAFAAKATVIHNGINVSNLLVKAENDEIPEALIGKQYVLNAATYEHKKGQDVLLRAFALLRADFPELFLVMMGRNAGTKDSLSKLARELAIAHRTLFLENVDHGTVLAAMQQAQVFVLPSRREPFGIVLLEAGLFDTPIVASRTGGITEILDDGHTALLVDPDDSQQLGNAIASCLADSTAAAQRAVKFRQRVITQFQWEKSAAQYIALVATENKTQSGGTEYHNS